MNFSWWTFALQAANFLILVWLLQRFLFNPVKAIIARRKEETSRAMAEASAQKQSAEVLKQELEAERSGIAAQRQKMIEEERALLAGERQKVIDDARREAEKIRDQAMKRLDEERAAAADKLFEQTVGLAAALAERLLREVAVGSIEQPFLDRVVDYLDQMPAAERAKLVPRNGASALLVTTAHPLDARAESDWREQLTKRLGTDLGIRFANDPQLIAGALITFPNAILRFNWRDGVALALEELRQDEHPR